MIKKILSGALLLSCLVIMMSAGDTKYKVWSATDKLTWADFHDTTILVGKRAALTSAGMTMSYKVSDDEMIMTCYSQMDPSRSWSDTAKRTPRILTHEQYHFNISEYWCRKFKKDVSSAHLTLKNYKDKIVELQKDNALSAKEMQTEYDTETKHSILKEEQKKWEAKIDELLKKTETFADKTVNLTLKEH